MAAGRPDTGARCKDWVHTESDGVSEHSGKTMATCAVLLTQGRVYRLVLLAVA